MTKVCFSKSFETSEPLKKVENGNVNEAQRLGCYKLQCILTWFSAYPIYALIIWISSIDKCLSSYDSMIFCFLIGLFSTVESISAMLFSPPRMYAQSYDTLETIDLEVLEKEKNYVRVMGRQQRMHGFTTLCTIWSIATVGILIAYNQLPCMLFAVVAASSFVLGVLATSVIYKVYSVGRWMGRYSISTINSSIFFQTLGFLFLIQGCLRAFSFSLILLGASIILATVLHLRFAFYFKNPPKHLSILTIKSTRAFLKNWFGWMLLGSSAVWIGLFLIGPLTGPSGSCSSTTIIVLLTFVISTPILAIWKIFFHCWQSRAMENKLNFVDV